MLIVANKINKYNDQNIFDYLLTNKGDVSSLFNFLGNQNINYDDFDTLPNIIYDEYTINDVTKYYLNNNITVVSKNSDFELYETINNYLSIESKPITQKRLVDKTNKFDDQNIFDYLLTNKGNITELFSFLGSQNINYDNFDSLPNIVYDTFNKTNVTDYYIGQRMHVASKNYEFDIHTGYGFSFGYTEGFNS